MLHHGLVVSGRAKNKRLSLSYQSCRLRIVAKCVVVMYARSPRIGAPSRLVHKYNCCCVIYARNHTPCVGVIRAIDIVVVVVMLCARNTHRVLLHQGSNINMDVML